MGESNLIVEKGTYVATAGDLGCMLIHDEYELLKKDNGFLLKSYMTIFGDNGFSQVAEMHLKNNLVPTQIKINVINPSLEFTCIIEDNMAHFVSILQPDNVLKKSIPILNDNYFFAFTGALMIPCFGIRRYDFSSASEQFFQILPFGTAQVKYIGDIDYNATTCKQLMIKQKFESQESVLMLICNDEGLVYYIKHDNILIKLKNA
jgi:hypothetical protein